MSRKVQGPYIYESHIVRLAADKRDSGSGIEAGRSSRERKTLPGEPTLTGAAAKAVCRACGGKLRLTGDKMNPETHGHVRYGIHSKSAGWDELVVCEDCGWNWWVHHA